LHGRQARGADGRVEAEHERERQGDGPGRGQAPGVDDQPPRKHGREGAAEAPRAASTRASSRNWTRICPSEAPSDLRRPISYLRSAKEISITERTPTPPTSSTVAD